MTKEHTNTYRTTARVVGVVYLAGFVVGIGGMGLYPIHSWRAESPCHGFRQQHDAGNRRDPLVDGRGWRRRARGTDVPDPQATQRAHRRRLPRLPGSWTPSLLPSWCSSSCFKYHWGAST